MLTFTRRRTTSLRTCSHPFSGLRTKIFDRLSKTAEFAMSSCRQHLGMGFPGLVVGFKLLPFAGCRCLILMQRSLPRKPHYPEQSVT